MSLDIPVPYCGTVPVPGHAAWNADPILATCLLAVAASYAFATRRQADVPARRQLCFWSGFAVLSLALVSPLCNLSVALFSARIGQHVILTTVAVPLLALGHIECILAAVPLHVRTRAPAPLRAAARALGGQAGAVIVFALVMWAWHWPPFYDATFRSSAIYWIMHASMMVGALLFWRASFRGSDSFAATLLAVFATMLQMSLLGALLTFAARPLYAVHAQTTWAWGISPLQDQQLGGLILWVVGGTLLTLYALAVLAEAVLRASASASPVLQNGSRPG